MKLSTRARYALRMMVTIAKQPGTNPISIGYVAETTSISKRYLDQLAIGLKTASLIRSMRGRGGGYRLEKPAEEISVGQIIEAAIGPINVVECVRRPQVCDRSDGCECRWVYERINSEIVGLLNGMSLAELADRNSGAPVTDGLVQLTGSTSRPYEEELSEDEQFPQCGGNCDTDRGSEV